MFYVNAVLDWIGITLEWAAAIGLISLGVYLALFPPGGAPAFRNVGIILIALGVGCVLLLTGEYLGRRACAEASLRAQISKQKNELKIWDASETAAQKLDDQLDTETDATAKLGAAFVKKIAVRPVCALTADDLSGLRSIR